MAFAGVGFTYQTTQIVAMCKCSTLQYLNEALTDESGTTSPEDLPAFEVATRDLVGVTLRSIEGGNVEVTLQLRLRMVLHEEGRLNSSQAARALGVAASTVTRLADRPCLPASRTRRGSIQS
ncbi:MarR family transcriptional regulator [Rhodococcus wratislaviensis IFP 2016]|nr:MarR family transcriptional regulator [Rhodococcus wratislaviensis IFP 2016]